MLKKIIDIAPSALDGNIWDTIQQNMTDEFVKQDVVCVENIGFISSVKVNIIDSKFKILVNGNVQVNLSIDFEAFLPLKDEIYDAIVDSVKSTGILVVVKKVMKCYIQPNTENKKRLQKGSEIRVKLISIRYDRSNYDGIGVEVFE